jgi:multidrug efflux pump subunit AcrB
VRRQGLTVEKGSSAFLQVIAFYAPDGRYDDIYISNYVTLNVLDEIKRVPGTTLVQIFGAKDYAMRIWLKPDRLAQLKLVPGDIIRALNEQNAQFAAGKVGETPTAGPQELVYTVTAKGRLSDPKEFEDIVLRANGDGSLLRLKDVARVELGGKDYSFLGKYNGNPATLMGVFLQPGANQLEVGEAVRTRLTELSQRFPAGFTYAIPFDTTMFVEVSIREVVKTLLEAMVLVFLVVYVFLQSWRATLIPFAAVPVSLIGTFAGLLLLGYSINTLTLFGMVLSIGIVVDDAIVERRAHHAGGTARAARRGDQGDEGGDEPHHRHRPRAVRRLHSHRLSGRPHRRAVPAVRGDHLDRRGDLGLRRAHADAEPVRDRAQARSQGARAAVRLVQPRLRAGH